MTWIPTSAGSYIKFYGAVDAEKNNLIDSAKSGTPTFASGDVTVPVNTGAVITNIVRNTTAGTFGDVTLTGIDAVDPAGIQGGDYLEFDAVNSRLSIPTITITGDFVYECDFISTSGTSNLDGVSLFASSSGNGSVGLWNNNSSFSGTNSVGCIALVSGFPTIASSAYTRGQPSHFKLTRTGATIEVEIDGAVVGSTASYGSGAITFNSIGAYNYAGTNYFQGGTVANVVLTWGGYTYKYDLNNITDNGDGTGNAPQTGTATHGDATVINFVAATDIIDVANNTFSYTLSEGAGAKLSSTEIAIGTSGIVPTLTASVDQGYTVTASQERSASEAGWRAFGAGSWAASGFADRTLTIELPAAKAIGGATLQMRGPNDYWLNWDIQGSTDGVTFSTLGSGVTDTSAPIAVQTIKFTSPTLTEYTHLRFSGTNGLNSFGNCGLSLLNFYDATTKDITLVNSPTWN
jgi:hypothetical protein